MLQKNRIWRRAVGGLLLFVFFCTYFFNTEMNGKIWKNIFLAADKEKEFFFSPTEEEEAYLAGLRGQVLFVGVAGVGIYEQQDGVPCGVTAPLVDVLHYEFGLDLRVVQGTWAENRAAMEDGNIDLLLGVPQTVQDVAERENEAGESLESGWYQSAWLYENPYVLVEYTGESFYENRKDVREKDNLTAKEDIKEIEDSGKENDPAIKEAEDSGKGDNPAIKEAEDSGKGDNPAAKEAGNHGQEDNPAAKEADHRGKEDDPAAKEADHPGKEDNPAAKEADPPGKDDPAATETTAKKNSLRICVAYIDKDPTCEAITRHLKKAPGLYFENIDTADGLEFLPCADEEAVLAALSDARADAGIVPEDILFLHYPAQDFSVSARLEAYGSRVAVGVADEKLVPLLEILDRYLETTKEGDELREAMRVQRQGTREGWVRKKEGGIIKKLRSRGADLQYAQAGLDSVPYFWQDEKGVHGELADFLAFVTACTGLSLKQSKISGEEALQALEDGEILFATGVPFLGEGQAYCFAGEKRKEALVMVVQKEEIAQFMEKSSNNGIKPEAITQYYWGVLQEWMPLFSGTVFDGHVVGFSDEKTLFVAMQAGELGGMLLGQGSYDALLLAGEDAYAIVEGISFPVRSGLAFSGSDQKAANFFGRLWQFYRALGYGSTPTPGTVQTQDGAAAQYRAAHARLQEKNRELTYIVWISGAAAVIFGAAFLVARRGGKKKRKG